jgi:hypothetical protein
MRKIIVPAAAAAIAELQTDSGKGCRLSSIKTCCSTSSTTDGSNNLMIIVLLHLSLVLLQHLGHLLLRMR